MNKKKVVGGRWGFKVKKGSKETTNIVSIDFIKRKIVWRFKTDEEYEDNIDDVELEVYVRKEGWLPVGDK